MSSHRIDAEINRHLGIEDVRHYLDAPVTEAERAEVRALYRWFTQRYPTPLDRLEYARRAFVRWQRLRP